MIEFGLKHYHSSGWHKKFPRQKIEREDPQHLGMHEHLRLRNEWFNGRKGYLSWKDLRKFFEANLGKNVDEVFSEYVKRAKRFNHDVNLKKRFYDELDPYRRWKSGYKVDSQNRIVRDKEEKPEQYISSREAFTYNELHYPSKSIKSYLRENQIVPLGKFYFRERWWGSWTKKLVYVCSKDWYNTVLTIGTGKQFVKMNNMHKVYIPFSKDNAYGVPKNGFESRNVPSEKKYYSSILGRDINIYETVHYPYSKERDPDFLFLVKGDFKQY